MVRARERMRLGRRSPGSVDEVIRGHPIKARLSTLPAINRVRILEGIDMTDSQSESRVKLACT